MGEGEKCMVCCITLNEPFVVCAECKPTINLCLKCFSKGSEVYAHASDHSYIIKTVAFSLFNEGKWSARDETKLLDAIEEKGFGNWKEISRKLPGKSQDECTRHYLEHYIEPSTSHPSFPKFEVNREHCFRRPLLVTTKNKAPRPNINDPDDMLTCVGYMPARGDFHVEYDNYAESDVKDVSFFKDDDDDELITELNYAMVEIYQTRLHDRRKRKRIMSDYGLMHNNMNFGLMRFCEYGSNERVLRDEFRKFTQLMKPDDHEKMIQSILYERYLMQRISTLQEYRSHGLKNFRAARLYEKLKTKRRQGKQTFSQLDEILLHVENPDACRIWLRKQMNGKKGPIRMPPMPMLNRKPVEPLDINGAPGVKNLTEDEKSLCSSLRFYPETYLSYRKALQTASETNGGLRLNQARTILKIDVNKTKKLFDFLFANGKISLGSSVK